MSRVKGHALRNEGAPFLIDERGRLFRVTDGYVLGGVGTAGLGRGVCECGEKSPIVDSAGQRKQWHRAHKAEVTA